jgi:hypothetical protein
MRVFARQSLSLPRKAGQNLPLEWEVPMLERREKARDKVIYAGIAHADDSVQSTNCVVRNISDNGARLEFERIVRLPKEPMRLTIARKGRFFLARIIWWRDNFVGVAFAPESPFELPGSDLAQRLRRSERKKRELQRRVKELIGEE